MPTQQQIAEVKVLLNNEEATRKVEELRKKYEELKQKTEAAFQADDGGAAGTDETVVYEGPGRSYTDTTTTGDKKVDTNKRKASSPVRFDEWPVAPEQEQTGRLVPMSGDILYVTKGCITEEWEVKDFEPDNNRSVVYGEMNRNLNMGGSL